MTDIPEHLIEAFCEQVKQNQDQATVVAAVLAALRPEDAHLVPAWTAGKAGLMRERDGWRDDARAEVLNREFWKAEATEARAEVERLERQQADLLAERAYLKAERERLRVRLRACDERLGAEWGTLPATEDVSRGE